MYQFDTDFVESQSLHQISPLTDEDPEIQK